jgi:hypothetical protein
MSGLGRVCLVVVALGVGLVASWLLAQWWSPVCHEGCPPAIQLSMWLFLLVLPLALAGVTAIAAARPQALARLGAALVALAVLGIVLTAVAAWFQGRAHGG